MLYDFNSNPTNLNFGGSLWDGVTGTTTGSANWRTNGGAGPAGSTTNGPVQPGVTGDGFMQLTFASLSCGPTPTFSSGLSGCMLFDDFDHGLVVAGFTLEADLRIGNGDPNPADGFSINYVRANDPILAALAAGDTFADMNGHVSPNGGQFSDNGSGTDLSLMEEGATTGLAIGFDMWDSGGYTIPPASPAVGLELPGLTHDGIGMDIRVDGVMQTTLSMPNGTTQATSDEHGNALTATDTVGTRGATDWTSIETGPYDGTACDSTLSWVHLKVVLDTNDVLNVWWKNHQILTNYQTTFFPSAGRLVLASRVGGNTANIEIDNIQITTIPGSVAVIGPAVGSSYGFQIQASDSGSSVIDTNRPITLTLNGASVPPVVSKIGGTTTVSYLGTTLFASGSTNTVVLGLQDTSGNPLTATRTFIAPSYGAIAAGDAIATGVDTSKPGFRLQTWQGTGPVTGVGLGEPNHIYWANEQVAGLHGTNSAVTTGFSDGGYMDFTSVINFDITPTPGDGNFQTNNGYPDVMFPGLPGSVGNGTDNASMEGLFFLQFASSGLYTLGVNSDDGFALTEGPNPKDRFANVLGSFDGGRGASDTTFNFYVPQAGIYPFRLLYYNGGGGANCEFFSVANGVKYLVNDPDPTNTSGVHAFYSGPARPAYVSQVNPYPGQSGAFPSQVLVQLIDGSTTVGNVSLTVDNQSSPAATVTKSGAVTTAKISYGSSNLLAPGAHTATLVWSDSATPPHTATNTWSFNVMNAPVMLDAGPSVPASAVDASQPGFKLTITQLDPSIVGDSGDGLANQSDSANALVGGLYFPWYGTNTVDAQFGSFSGIPADTNNIWYYSNAIDFNVSGSAGDFPLNYFLPGIQGVTLSLDNYATWFDGWVVFPNTGFTVLGVNSDDGFRLSEGTGLLRQVLHVNGTNGVNTDVAAVVSVTNYGNGGFGASLPLAPLVAPVFYVSSNNYTVGGSINLSGKIALVDQGLYGAGDALLAYIAQTNGAVGFILINAPANGLPYVMGGTAGTNVITIPSLCVNGDFGQRDFWLTNGNLTASIGASDALVINSADYGKGLSHQDAGVIVPTAGAYPIHLTYFQGGGGAGLEWSSLAPALNADGVRSLINDTNDVASLIAYRAVTVGPRPTLSLGKQGNSWVITYTGKLYSAPTITGTFSPVAGASSPYTVPTGAGAMQFYRAGP